ncbi:MAG: spore coat U domain-containing protein [Pseudomonas sp.]|nr:spore coat U domain-containing protein [Pseudomonas sp.]
MKRTALTALLFSGVMLWTAPILAIDLFTGCRISATDVVFGSYVPFNVSESIGSVSLSCGSLITLVSNSISYEVKLSSGGSSPLARKMSKGNDKLGYNLYMDSSYNTFWGETTPNTHIGKFKYSGLLGVIVVMSEDFSVHGRIPAGQFVSAGNYSDLVTVTVMY